MCEESNWKVNFIKDQIEKCIICERPNKILTANTKCILNGLRWKVEYSVA